MGTETWCSKGPSAKLLKTVVFISLSVLHSGLDKLRNRFPIYYCYIIFLANFISSQFLLKHSSVMHFCYFQSRRERSLSRNLCARGRSWGSWLSLSHSHTPCSLWRWRRKPNVLKCDYTSLVSTLTMLVAHKWSKSSACEGENASNPSKTSCESLSHTDATKVLLNYRIGKQYL